METISYSSPSPSLPPTMDSPDTHDFLKMEDVAPSTFAAGPSATPAPVVVHSKPAKKRKSWGQELPEPKTSLPPRKRAKTEDEKEQRRIERIKRNRAAAHNSRERKRQETETYAVALARAQAELNAYREHFGALPSNIILPEVTLSTVAEYEATPAPSLVESRGSVVATSPASAIDDSFEPTNVVIKQEPDITFATPFAPPPFALPEPSKPSAAALLDMTQHSAEMLCDLPCLSRQRSSSRAASSTPLPATLPPTFWTTLFLQLTHNSLTFTYKTILLAIWSHSPSRMARSMQASQLRLTSRLTNSSTTTTTPRRRLRSTRALAQRNAATRHRVGPTQGAISALPQSTTQRLVGDGVQRSYQRVGARQNQDRIADSREAFRESQGQNDQEDGQRHHGVGGQSRP